MGHELLMTVMYSLTHRLVQLVHSSIHLILYVVFCVSAPFSFCLKGPVCILFFFFIGGMVRGLNSGPHVC
jgi:hypothetical protein